MEKIRGCVNKLCKVNNLTTNLGSYSTAFSLILKSAAVGESTISLSVVLVPCHRLWG